MGGSPPPAGNPDDDAQAHRWLDLLRDGSPEEKASARRGLAAVFEARGMLREAVDLLTANVREGFADVALLQDVARLNQALGDEYGAASAGVQAARLSGGAWDVPGTDVPGSARPAPAAPTTPGRLSSRLVLPLAGVLALWTGVAAVTWFSDWPGRGGTPPDPAATPGVLNVPLTPRPPLSQMGEGVSARTDHSSSPEAPHSGTPVVLTASPAAPATPGGASSTSAPTSSTVSSTAAEASPSAAEASPPASAVGPAPPPSPSPPGASPAAAPTTAERVVANAGREGVRLRASPGSGVTLKTVPDGARLTLLGESRWADGRAWHRVRDTAGTEGWIAADYLAEPPEHARQPTPTALTSTPTPAPSASRTPTPARSGSGGRAAPTGGSCPPSHPIKGNLAASGERIYHLPGGAFYGRTFPEACFASEADARAAGFRRSLR